MAERRKYKKQDAPGSIAGPGHGPGARGGYQKPKSVRKTGRRLLSYITRRKLPIIAVVLCLLISSGAQIGGTYMLRPILNDLVGSDTVADKLASLGASVLTLGLIYLLGSLLTYCQAAIMVQLAQRGTNRLRKDLFNKLQDLPLSYFDSHTHGELMSRFSNDADNVQIALEQSLTSLLSSGLTFIGIIAAMIFTCPPLFLVTILTLTASLLVFKKLGGKSRQYYRKQQAALGEVNGNIQEIIEGLKVVKAFGHEEHAKAEFAELNATYRDAAKKANFYSTAIMPTTANIMNVGYALTAVVGGLLSIMAGFDLGGLATYLQYSRQIGMPLNQVSQQLTAILSALAGAERIFEIMDLEPEIDAGKVTLVPAYRDENGAVKEQPGGTRTGTWAWKVPLEDGGYDLVELRGEVKLINVDFGYIPGKPVLKNVSVYANHGQKIAFVGSTGAGKTTITNLLNRFYEIGGGNITYDGINILDIKKDDLRRSMGAVLQDTHLFTGTVMDNIRYGRLDATDAECISAAKSSNAHSFIRRLPEGYETMVTGDGANLSQGQRQLLAIARAAVADPPVMVLDEATSSIDTRTERLIEKGMDTLMEHRTVFVIAHRLSTVRNSNCIVVIEHGEIVEKGTHAELLTNEGRYYMLYTGQHQLD